MTRARRPLLLAVAAFVGAVVLTVLWIQPGDCGDCEGAIARPAGLVLAAGALLCWMAASATAVSLARGAALTRADLPNVIGGAILLWLALAILLLAF